MLFDLQSITSETRLRAPRIILLGVEKIGKSTFAAGADSSVFLPIKGEEGIDDIPVAKTPVCNTFNDVMGWLYGLGEQKHTHQTVVIDSASALEPIINAGVCQQSQEVWSKRLV